MGKLVDSYNRDKITICALGSHSALDILDGAKDEGFPTLAVCQKGREKPYKAFRRIVDEVMLLDEFSAIIEKRIQDQLVSRNCIFVPHRSFTAYIDYESIEDTFELPLFGNRGLLRIEERTGARNQYDLLKKAGIRIPKRFANAREVEDAAIVKVQEAKRKLERAFFTISSYKDYVEKSQKMVKEGLVSEADLGKAVIEEFVLGTYFNFNYFYSPLAEEVELLGIDRRLQTNLNDFVSLPARQQLEIEPRIQNIEIGHTPATIRESMLQKVLEMGEKFARAVKEEYGVGPIGPFALQSSVTVDLDIVVFDVSPRVPGSPIIATTSPYSKYYFGKVVGTGRRIAMEIKKGIEEDRLSELVT
jgi:5-formaminoimidazole-4-carboxamide-1-(beta)-D-ribofuranosyl 5'-monophosphate synthetase